MLKQRNQKPLNGRRQAYEEIRVSDQVLRALNNPKEERRSRGGDGQGGATNEETLQNGGAFWLLYAESSVVVTCKNCVQMQVWIRANCVCLLLEPTSLLLQVLHTRSGQVHQIIKCKTSHELISLLCFPFTITPYITPFASYIYLSTNISVTRDKATELKRIDIKST